MTQVENSCFRKGIAAGEVVLLLGQVWDLAKMYRGCCFMPPLRIFCLGIECNVRCLFIESGVRALRIVKADPVIDDPFCLETVGDFMQIDGLLLQGSPQSSNKDVVAITAPAIH